MRLEAGTFYWQARCGTRAWDYGEFKEAGWGSFPVWDAELLDFQNGKAKLQSRGEANGVVPNLNTVIIRFFED
jgi:hypothetical protein